MNKLKESAWTFSQALAKLAGILPSTKQFSGVKSYKSAYDLISLTDIRFLRFFGPTSSAEVSYIVPIISSKIEL